MLPISSGGVFIVWIGDDSQVLAML